MSMEETMNVTRRTFAGCFGLALVTTLAACEAKGGKEQSTDTATGGSTSTATQSDLKLDNGAWSYDADNDTYYQLGISYCTTPADESYEKLAVLVPGAFFKATDNGNGTFTCAVDESAKVGSYTARTAPIVMPVNTPGYSAQKAMDSYQAKASYTGKGIVYVHAGCRGRDAGAPTGIVDLKAAVRFLRHVSDSLPGNTDRIFTFGHSGGGAQSALMGATGNSSLYDPYLQAIGAASDKGDAIFGSMDWCPITGLDVADEAYEWMMGSTRSDLAEDEQSISNGLARAYADWVNKAGIVDEKGASLTLVESGEGIYQAGSYYEAVRGAIEKSLNDFLSDTTFPYDGSSSGHTQAGMGDAPGGDGGPGGDGEPGGGRPEGGMPDGGAPNGSRPEGMAGGPGGNAGGGGGGQQRDNISRQQTSGGLSLTGTYDTAEAYIAALNAEEAWVTYDATTNTATITSVAAFVKALKRASKSLGAFDQLNRGQGENTLFGENGNASHFDARMADVLKELGSPYAGEYASDLRKADSLGTDVGTRVSMYTPLYYLLASEKGYGTSEPAKHWRIRTGINQGDTALTTELNLAWALRANGQVESVDFATVWGQGHTQAERTGSAESNFIDWIATCTA